MIDWTTVIAAGVGALIPTLPAYIGARHGRHIRAAIETPSGDSIGLVAERTHDLAAVATLSTTAAMRQGNEPPVVAPGEGLDHVVDRINADTHGPIIVNGEAEGFHTDRQEREAGEGAP